MTTSIAIVSKVLVGKNYAYSSVGTELVAHALERIYGERYESLLAKFLTREAGMHDVRLRLPADAVGRLAPGGWARTSSIRQRIPMPVLDWYNAIIKVEDFCRYLVI